MINAKIYWIGRTAIGPDEFYQTNALDHVMQIPAPMNPGQVDVAGMRFVRPGVTHNQISATTRDHEIDILPQSLSGLRSTFFQKASK